MTRHALTRALSRFRLPIAAAATIFSVVLAGSPAAAEWLLPDYRTCRFIVNIEIPRRIPQFTHSFFNNFFILSKYTSS